MEKQKTCQAKRYDTNPCGRTLYDDKHCMFHSENIEGKRKEFNDAFWKEYERQKKEDGRYDFCGFIFPDSISFNKKLFETDTFFIGAEFCGGLTSFKATKFSGTITLFDESKFSGKEIDFSESEFSCKSTSFAFAEFRADNTKFIKAKFSGLENWVNFKTSKFHGKIIDFSESEFSGEVTIFDYAELSADEIKFIGTKFLECPVSFKDTTFSGGTTGFSGSEFTGEKTEFLGTNFLSKNTFFNKVKFTGNILDISDAKFSSKSTFFWESRFLNKVVFFRNTKFDGELTSFYKAEFSNELTDFQNTMFLSDSTEFEEAKFSSKLINLFNSHFKNITGLFEALRFKTKTLNRIKYNIIDFKFKLGEESATRYPIIKRKTQDEWFIDDFKKQYPLIYIIWKLTSDCGRSILRWAVWSLGIALLFAIIFLAIGHEAFETRHHTWFSFFYYSIVTFTTLGFGDITPIKWYTEIIVTIEVILGYIMLGGLISIFATKLARRS